MLMGVRWLIEACEYMLARICDRRVWYVVYCFYGPYQYLGLIYHTDIMFQLTHDLCKLSPHSPATDESMV